MLESQVFGAVPFIKPRILTRIGKLKDRRFPVAVDQQKDFALVSWSPLTLQSHASSTPSRSEFGGGECFRPRPRVDSGHRSGQLRSSMAGSQPDGSVSGGQGGLSKDLWAPAPLRAGTGRHPEV